MMSNLEEIFNENKIRMQNLINKIEFKGNHNQLSIELDDYEEELKEVAENNNFYLDSDNNNFDSNILKNFDVKLKKD